MNHGKKTFYDLTPQPKDVIAEKLDKLIETVEFLIMETEGRG